MFTQFFLLIYQSQESVELFVNHTDVFRSLFFCQGFGHAVLCAKEFVGNEPFFVFLGDHVYLRFEIKERAFYKTTSNSLQ
jgi:UTP-glucose-1-phosphate uridylyltransferase